MQGNNLWVPREEPRRLAPVRQHGAGDGRRPRRLELRRAIRRPEQRRPARPLPDQRLRLRRPKTRATGTTTRRSPAATAPIIGDAANWPAMRHRSLVGLPAEAGVDQRRRRPASSTWRRWSASPSATTAAPWRSPTCAEPRCARRRRRQPARAAAALQERRRAGSRMDRLRSARRLPQRCGRRRLLEPQRHRRAGRGVLERQATAAGGVRAAAVSARRTSGDCTSGWGRTPPSSAWSSAGRRARRRN